MLTKDLLCYKLKKNGKITPQLLKPKDSQLLSIAENLISVFQEHVGDIRKNLAEACKVAMDTAPCEGVVARGFEKLLLDRTSFETGVDQEQVKLRDSIFLSATQILKTELQRDSEGTELLQDYHQKIAKQWGESAENLAEKLYQDLPPYQKILEFKKISPEALIHRYNCAQVQGLLIYSSQIKLSLKNTEPALMRQLLKYLRFYQLLVHIKASPQGYNIIIDGPLNLFQQSRKYGLQLANFFPAILTQTQWSLSAEIRIRKRGSHLLELEESCGIRSHYQHFNAYVPESFNVLQKSVEEKLPEWKLYAAENFLPLPGEVYCFPDYKLCHCTGSVVFLELFHAWHSAPLLERLKQLSSSVTQNPKTPLILAVCKKLMKDEQILKALENSEYYSQWGITFREIPTITQLSKVLKSITIDEEGDVQQQLQLIS